MYYAVAFKSIYLLGEYMHLATKLLPPAFCLQLQVRTHTLASLAYTFSSLFFSFSPFLPFYLLFSFSLFLSISPM